MKILVLGSTGMAGHVIFDYLKSLNRYDIYDGAHRNKLHNNSILVDVYDKPRLKQIILDLNPDCIINCIGILINGSNEQPENAIYINSYFPHYLAGIGKNNNIGIIHLSTDCVFSGLKGSYKEDDFKDGKDLYAQSKSLGEIVDDRNLTIRMSIIGPELKHNGEGLFHWFMMQQGTISGFVNVFWSGITTFELARVIDQAIGQKLTGLYHLAPDEKISKYDLLSLIKNVWHRDDIIINKDFTKHADKSLINTRRDFHYVVPSYREMIENLYDYMNQKRDFYAQYFMRG